MNPIGLMITTTLVATFVVFCGIKLFDMGSELADLIRKYGAVVGIILAFTVAVGFLIPDTIETSKQILVAPTVIMSALVFMVLGYLLDILRKRLTSKKRLSSKTSRVPRSITASVGLICIAENAVMGIVIGYCFLQNIGSGIMALCALVLYLILANVENIRRFQDARFSRRQNIIIVSASLFTLPVAAIVTFMITRTNYLHLGTHIAIAAGFFFYLMICYLLDIIAKLRQKR